MSIMTKIFGPSTNPGINPNAVNPATMQQGNQAAQVQASQGTVHDPAQNLQSKQDAGTAANGVVPANGTGGGAEGRSGLDSFNDLWKTEPTQNQTQGQPLFNLSQEQIMAASKKQDFTKGIATQEQLTKVAAGGQEAVVAMMEMMNAMGQMVYAQNAVATTKLIEGALDKSQFAKVADLDSHMKRHTLSTTLPEINPLFSSPAAQPIIDGLSQQFMVKFPNSTPKEISGMVNDYLTHFTGAFTAPATAAKQKEADAKSNGTDWDKFLM